MNILTEVKKAVFDLSINKVAEGTHLKDDFGLDSLGISNLILKLEEVFNIEIALDLLIGMPFETVNDVCEIIKKSIGE